MPPAETAVLRRDTVAVTWSLRDIVLTDGARRGAVAAWCADGAVRRAEPGPHGALVFEARDRGGRIDLTVHGPRDTAAMVAERALAAAHAWVGCHDDDTGFTELADADPMLRTLRARVGDAPLSRLPRVEEAFGRAVLGQLVQVEEARRSGAALTLLAGAPGWDGLWHWPTPSATAATSSWELRQHCGVSARSVRALHAGALDAPRLAALAASGDWAGLDRRLRALPGVGAWTSAQTRLALGDPDAVSVGDYHLPAVIGHALGGPDAPAGGWTDAELLELLAPFAGHRGRVVRLIQRAMWRRAGPRPPRRAPRAALSRHRYW